ncbi:hypothetical protein PMIT1320_00643 [Prochlorococcus marinus str. MIT 1320]|nr:hypothetical protein PMIT1320_00643 [Prochlorococcus marinus str. MIT 1320]
MRERIKVLALNTTNSKNIYNVNRNIAFPIKAEVLSIDKIQKTTTYTLSLDFA